jgi:DNA-binding MarR family transcriptional regulator
MSRQKSLQRGKLDAGGAKGVAWDASHATGGANGRECFKRETSCITGQSGENLRRAAGDGMTDGSKLKLKLWLRLLRATRARENHLREYLRRDHSTTLPRFDVMAALFRARDAMTMSDLSRLLLVSNGNVTAVVDRLESDGLVRRVPSDADRRTVHVSLTPEGRAQFEILAKGHEAEVDGLFDGLGPDGLVQLDTLLRQLDPPRTGR